MREKYHIITVVGARPQFIKAAALSRAIKKSDLLTETIVHSGQHYDSNLSDAFFTELNIPKPKYNLGIGSVTHNVFIGQFLILFDQILQDERPDMVIVYGDTNTTSAAAIGTAKRNIPLAHVEAGLREWDKSIPEEVNKLLTDSVADLFFSPTKTGIDNLSKVGVTKNVHMTGDISLDLLFDQPHFLPEEVIRQTYALGADYIFMTCHRDANTNNKEYLKAILKAVSTTDRDVVFPIHPRTRNAINKFELWHSIDTNVHVIEPLGFWETQSLLKYASLAVTDSGGIIKEAYFHKTPAIIIDKQTEWLETIEEGWNILTGPSFEHIARAIKSHKTPQIHTNALGNGTCGKQIVEIIESYLDK